MLTVTVHSGQNLLRGPNDIDITPRLYAYAFGIAEVELGCTKSTQTTNNPIWGDSWKIEFFRVFQLRFELYHHRTILPDVFLGHCTVDLEGFRFGQPVSLPLKLAFQTTETCTICIELSMNIPPRMLNPFAEEPMPLRDGATVKSHDVYMYLTYDPPIQDPAEALPVTFRLPTCIGEDRISCVFDQDTDWTRIGFSGNGQCFQGPTGVTHVGVVRTSILERMQCVVELICREYEGKVTLNLVDLDPETKMIKRTEKGKSKSLFLFQNTVDCTKDSVVILPFVFRFKDETVQAAPLDVPQYDGSVPLFQFDDELTRRIALNNPMKRTILSRTEAVALEDMAEMSGNPVPQHLNLVFGYEWATMNNLRGKHARNMYAIVGFDSTFKPICEITPGTIKYQVKCPNGELTPDRGTFFGAGSGRPGPAYLDELMVSVDLTKVPLDVKVFVVGARCINAPSLTSTPDDQCPIPVTLRYNVMEYVKIIDADTKREIGLFQGNRSLMGMDVTYCMAAMFRTADSWKWAPLNKAVSKSVPIQEYFADVWREVAAHYESE